LPSPDAGAGYFVQQSRTIEELKRALAERHGPLDPDPGRALHLLRRAIRERAQQDPAGVQRDRALLAELQRLVGFDPALYDRAELAPEQLNEVMKRTRSSLLTRGFANALHNTVPVAAGPRTAHVRVAEPIAVSAVASDPAAARASLLHEH